MAVELDALDETDPEEELRPEEAGPNFNVAPTTKVLTLVQRHDRGHTDDAARRRIRRMRWGLVPHFTKPAEPGVPAKGKPLFNARADKAATTPAFRDALKFKRCLVPMDGWYEWLTADDGPKTPFFMTAQPRLYVAGLWSVWRDGSAPPLLSCTILTVDAVGDLQRVHDRMPFVLPEARWDSWLDPDDKQPEMHPPSAADVADIEIRPVSPAVNSVKNNAPELLDRVDPDSKLSLF